MHCLARLRSSLSNNMDACVSVDREQERLSQKYSSIKERTDSSLTELINQISNIQEELSKGIMKALFS